MKVQLVAAFLAVCLLSLQGIRAAPNSGSFDGNDVGSNSFNDNGNSYAAGNGGSFDDNTVGDNSFNNNGNNDGSPVVWY
ncbi:insoluble matrix shell protein 4-like [Eublepharis macularius]|uniref:Insoluble matrix shell protein 4-like n=1 Tax=Eublepharis macularius TaxID=481883 RepID=A0AA97KFG4_EUBMA|nr:insoluble matrix shell protein 4-like [Eublepharis macularius]